jgi:membrane protein required for colicin V production
LVTQFDAIVFALLLISAMVGFSRGAVREVVAMAALVIAAVAAVLGLKVMGPAMGRLIATPWISAVAALLLVFAAVYVAVRLAGAGLAKRIHRADVLGALDRTIGLLIGLVRGLVVLGALYLMFNAATPVDLQPRWIVQARSWPLAADMGRLLEALAPSGLDLAGRLRPAFTHAVQDRPSGDRNATEGYDARERGEIDELVEKTR